VIFAIASKGLTSCASHEKKRAHRRGKELIMSRKETKYFARIADVETWVEITQEGFKKIMERHPEIEQKDFDEFHTDYYLNNKCIMFHENYYRYE
jgi:GTP1/Obg family GTP-binding protein